MNNKCIVKSVQPSFEPHINSINNTHYPTVLLSGTNYLPNGTTYVEMWSDSNSTLKTRIQVNYLSSFTISFVVPISLQSQSICYAQVINVYNNLR